MSASADYIYCSSATTTEGKGNSAFIYCTAFPVLCIVLHRLCCSLNTLKLISTLRNIPISKCTLQAQSIILTIQRTGSHVSYFKLLKLIQWLTENFSHYLCPLGIIHQIFDLCVNTQWGRETHWFFSFQIGIMKLLKWRMCFPSPLWINSMFWLLFSIQPRCVCLRLSQWVCVGGGKQVFPWLITAFSSRCS